MFFGNQRRAGRAGELVENFAVGSAAVATGLPRVLCSLKAGVSEAAEEVRQRLKTPVQRRADPVFYSTPRKEAMGKRYFCFLVFLVLVAFCLAHWGCSGKGGSGGASSSIQGGQAAAANRRGELPAKSRAEGLAGSSTLSDQRKPAQQSESKIGEASRGVPNRRFRRSRPAGRGGPRTVAWWPWENLSICWRGQVCLQQPDGTGTRRSPSTSYVRRTRNLCARCWGRGLEGPPRQEMLPGLGPKTRLVFDDEVVVEGQEEDSPREGWPAETRATRPTAEPSEDPRKFVIPFDFVSQFDGGRYGQMVGEMIWKKLQREGGFLLPGSMLEVRDFCELNNIRLTPDTPLEEVGRVVRELFHGHIAIWGSVERAPGYVGCLRPGH